MIEMRIECVGPTRSSTNNYLHSRSIQMSRRRLPPPPSNPTGRTSIPNVAVNNAAASRASNASMASSTASMLVDNPY